MKLEKAIEIQKDDLDCAYGEGDKDKRDAQKLGIEALNRINFMRSYNIDQAKMPLPGEREK